MPLPPVERLTRLLPHRRRVGSDYPPVCFSPLRHIFDGLSPGCPRAFDIAMQQPDDIAKVPLKHAV